MKGNAEEGESEQELISHRSKAVALICINMKQGGNVKKFPADVIHEGKPA